jgi:hypothetical protein
MHKKSFIRAMSFLLMAIGTGTGLAAQVDNAKQSSTKPSVGTASVAQIAPKIGFDHVAYSPSPTTVGAHLNVSVAVKNKGVVPTGPNFKFQMTCSIVSGSVCPIASNASPIAIPNLPVGNQKSFTFVSASAAQAGKYKLQFKILDAALQTVATSEIEINVTK